MEPIKKRSRPRKNESPIIPIGYEATQNTKWKTELQEFNPILRYYIEYYENVGGDGHCGFRSIAKNLGYDDENGWKIVRKELLQELTAYELEYKPIYGGEERFNELKRNLECTSTYTINPKEWFTLPCMGWLVTNAYNRPFVCISREQSQTFLPMRTKPYTVATITIGYLRDVFHYVPLKLMNDGLLPPIIPGWVQLCIPIAIDWKSYFQAKFDFWTRAFPLKDPRLSNNQSSNNVFEGLSTPVSANVQDMVIKKRDRVESDNNDRLCQEKRRKENQVCNDSSLKLQNENINNLQVDKRSLAQQARRAREKIQKSSSSLQLEKRSLAQQARRTREKFQKSCSPQKNNQVSSSNTVDYDESQVTNDSSSKIPNEKRSLAQKARRTREHLQKRSHAIGSSSTPSESQNVFTTSNRIESQESIGVTVSEDLGSSSSTKNIGNLNNTQIDKRSITKEVGRTKHSSTKSCLPSKRKHVNNKKNTKHSRAQIQRRINEKHPKMYEMDRSDSSSPNFVINQYSRRPGKEHN